MAGVWLFKVSTDGRCLVIEGVHWWNVSGYWRCPLTRGIWLLKVSTEGWCWIIESVHLREVSGYWRCPLTDGVVRCCCTNAWLIRSLEKAGFKGDMFVAAVLTLDKKFREGWLWSWVVCFTLLLCSRVVNKKFLCVFTSTLELSYRMILHWGTTHQTISSPSCIN